MSQNNLNIEFLNDQDKCINLFEAVPNHLKPAWLTLILSYFENYLQEVPKVVTELIKIVDDNSYWYQAKSQGIVIAKYRNKIKDITLENYLLLAEKIAYITYDIFRDVNNFDNKSGFEFVHLANVAGQNCTENHFIIYDLESGFTLFKYKDKLNSLIKTTEDFRLFRKIDEIVWRDWDPLDLNKRWLRHEYISYIPEIFNLVKSKEYSEIIAHHLYNLEINYFNIYQPSFNKLKILAIKMSS